MEITPPEDEALELFWAEARKIAGLTHLDGIVGMDTTASLVPPAWSFGSTAEMADELLDLVLAGEKTATASARWEWEADHEEPPTPGDLAILCDGAGEPRALIRTDDVEIVPFDQVGEEHATAEGEGDRSLAHWRSGHQEYFTESLAAVGRTFAPDMPVVLETFTLLHPRPRRRRPR
ncbi:ASCH domain-containing protein [Georgenia subflava]|uniref:ASCH domain-containing protein n=1 Tax=Georgenia subflava TaxID=1622177 RepID=A0A6N7EJ29_9MICO|nr:ASCH domain-containing protein [Georgenia subflava]MPV37431.1 ASCH domain-containing protein [Georgenia subflava]